MFDFQYDLLRAKEFIEWRNTGLPKNLQTEINIMWSSEGIPKDKKSWCPVGSIEFCQNWYKEVFGEYQKPKNIPRPLISFFTLGDIYPIVMKSDKLEENKEWFVKSRDIIKFEGNGVYTTEELYGLLDLYPEGSFQVTKYTPDIIMSEWRVFVFDNKIEDLRPYILPNEYPGKLIGPDSTTIEDMIYSWSSVAPCAYTLDVAIDIYQQTSILEVHDFFSCGTYGFFSENYPVMLWRWYIDKLCKSLKQ